MKRFPVLLAVFLFAAAGFAQAENCTVRLEGNDRMQYDLKEVTVNASCETITLELHHVGALPLAAMGHSIVIAASADVAGVASDGLKATLADGYIKPGDTRVIAHTSMIGGGETTTTTFPGNTLTAGGDYTFFCTFPGHSALMRGKLVVEP